MNKPTIDLWKYMNMPTVYLSGVINRTNIYLWKYMNMPTIYL